MKKFMAIYIGTGDLKQKWNALSEQEQQESMRKGISEWTKWDEAKQAVIGDKGQHLGSTKKIDTTGISDSQNSVCGYTIVEAESHDKAAELLLNHPHFAIFPGQSVEIIECMPIPTAA